MLLTRLLSNMNTVTAIRLPPYYAELNSNELSWAMLKGKVARSSLTFKKDTDTASDCGSTDDERTPQRMRDMKRLEISLLC